MEEMINVNFRVTGLYFGRNSAMQDGAVTVSVPKNPNVYQIMKAVSEKVSAGKIHNVKLFSFDPPKPTSRASIKSIHVRYESDARPSENEKLSRNDGLYSLVDTENDKQSLTFQYYIHDENFTQLNVNNFSKTFNESPDVEIKEGYTIIIRQIMILKSSNNEFSDDAERLNNKINSKEPTS